MRRNRFTGYLAATSSGEIGVFRSLSAAKRACRHVAGAMSRVEWAESRFGVYTATFVNVTLIVTRVDLSEVDKDRIFV